MTKYKPKQKIEAAEALYIGIGHPNENILTVPVLPGTIGTIEDVVVTTSEVDGEEVKVTSYVVVFNLDEGLKHHRTLRCEVVEDQIVLAWENSRYHPTSN